MNALAHLQAKEPLVQATGGRSSVFEDAAKGYQAYVWQVLEVQDGNEDTDAIRKTIAAIRPSR